MLKENWLVATSTEDTLHNVIEAGDVDYLKTVAPAEFERLLIREVKFLIPHQAWVEYVVKEYIPHHRDELYRFLHSLPSRT